MTTSLAAVRQIFINHGHPGLGPVVRAAVMPVEQLRQTIDEALHGVADLRHARLLALALCWHDHWDAAHQVCVAHEGDQPCDLIHMILHRREPDADNCRYWIARVGWHPLYDELPAIAVTAGMADSTLTTGGRWHPERFMERCLHATDLDRAVLEQVQAAELLALRERLLDG